VIVKMVEFKDASEAERACRLCNSGLMALRSRRPVRAARPRRQ
jgi:bifunctional UDP-N-acetylglucosamine pyrophosphorylase/glucosamine-1-phosphate N-acetyltransferase